VHFPAKQVFLGLKLESQIQSFTAWYLEVLLPRLESWGLKQYLQVTKVSSFEEA
jgi:hypothetical protein